jgi:PadR family transcriptional regulator PadR
MEQGVTQMRKGLLEYCVMALLQERRRYGYELVQELSEMDGLLTSEGTIYPLLSRLRRDRLVETEWQESPGGPPRKYYALTKEGERALGAFMREWRSFSASVNEILSKASGGSKK